MVETLTIEFQFILYKKQRVHYQIEKQSLGTDLLGWHAGDGIFFLHFIQDSHIKEKYRVYFACVSD